MFDWEVFQTCQEVAAPQKLKMSTTFGDAHDLRNFSLKLVSQTDIAKSTAINENLSL